MELIKKYFPALSADQLNKLSALQPLYSEWNDRINVISRKDIDHLYERHILHSLAIAKFISFRHGVRVLDVGTGGGFPGIPLAIFFPEVKFHLVDSVGKKIKVVRAIAEELKLKNVSSEKLRAEELKGQFDFVVSRAVAPMKTVYSWTKDLIRSSNTIAQGEGIANHGWVFLKGGDLRAEIQELKKNVNLIPVSEFFEEDFFKEKFIVFFR